MMITKTKRNTIISATLFLVCLAVYASNGETIAQNDSVATTLLALNLLENHTLNFDLLRDSYFFNSLGAAYVFTESSRGHLTTVYPIGTAIVTFPIYFFAYLFLKISSVPVDIASPYFENYRLLFEKVAATIVAAASVVLFYLSSRLKFSWRVSAVLTFTFAFCINTWIIGAQALWQHGATNLLLLICLFCLLKANRQTTPAALRPWLLCAGFACGMLPVTRQTSLCFLWRSPLPVWQYIKSECLPLSWGQRQL
ncbi:MAG: hypothetical protein ACFB16_06060 [Phormidesmis sp.]